MDPELAELIDYRFYSGVAILIGSIIAIIGGFYLREFNNKIASFRQTELVNNQANLETKIERGNQDIIKSQKNGDLELEETIKKQSGQLRNELKSSEGSILTGQKKISEQIEKIVSDKEIKNQKLVIASVNDGSKIIPDPKDFKSAGAISGNAHEKRKKSWSAFKAANRLASRDITIEVSNYRLDPIVDVSLIVKWNLPTYKTEPSFGGDHDKYRVFSTYFYQKTEDFKNSIEPPEWTLVRYKDEMVKIAKIEANQTVKIVLRRITDKNFLKKPTLELTFKDIEGEIWKN